MAVATGTALAIGAGVGGLTSLLSSREQRRAARAASQPQRFDETSFLTPYGPAQPLLDAILGGINPALSGGLEGLGRLSFPEYTPFSFSPIGVNIPGASRRTEDILQEIRALVEGGSPYLDLAEEELPGLVESLRSREAIKPLVALLSQGILPETLAGRFLEQGNPFEDEVISSLRADMEEALADELLRIESDAAGVGRSGAAARAGEAAGRTRESFAEALAAQIGGLRAANFEAERNRQGQGLGIASSIAGNIGALDAQRLGQLTSALSLTPELERARFIGPGIAGDMALNIDQLAQAAAIERARAAVQQHLFAGQVGLANAQGLNNFNLAELDFDRQQLFDPFLMLGGALDLALPVATAFGTQRRFGTNQSPRPYAPSALGGGLTGALGGLALAGGLGRFGGGGFNAQLLNRSGLNPMDFASAFWGLGV